MTDREKLIEMIVQGNIMAFGKSESFAETIADNLISNGVTFAKDIEPRVYDKEEVYTNCTVQILTNTVTGDVSVGWWRNDKLPKGEPPCEK